MVGFIEGTTRGGFTDETANLLCRRLKAATLVLSIGLAIAFANNLYFGDAPWIGLRAAILVAVVGIQILLRSSVRFSLTQLHIAELVSFGAVGVQVVMMVFSFVPQFMSSGDSVSIVSVMNQSYMGWTFLILFYSTFIPNDWKRAAAILFPAASIPYVVEFVLRWRDEAVDSVFRADQFGMPLPMPLLAAAAGVFGAHVIYTVRREAFDAKQLGQYRLKDKIGSGGMGDVYQAEHQLLKRPCAVKLIGACPHRST